MKKVLITGAGGCSGKYLTQYLKSQSDHELFLTDRNNLNENNFIKADILSVSELEKVLEVSNPDYIYHLAGTVTNNFEIDYNSNVLSTKNIFDYVIKNGLKTKILLIGSAAEYGIVENNKNPVKESHSLLPVSVYGLTKVFQTELFQYYFRIKKLNIVMARTFNLNAKGLKENLFIGKLYKQIEEWKEAKRSKFEFGSLESYRDYIHINDAVKYYVLLMHFGKAGEVYNVGSGNSIQMKELMRSILNKENIKDFEVVENSYIPLGKQNVSNIYANIEKLKKIIKMNKVI